MSVRKIPKDWAYWFTGLCDGEASFTIAAQWAKEHIHPRFAISMQQDDKLLLEVQAVFGFGSLCFNQPSCMRKDGSGFGPKATLSIDKRCDLQFMCEFFDTYPLRSKKKAEFELWRAFAVAYCDKTASFRELVELAIKVSNLNQRRSGFVARARAYLSQQAALAGARKKLPFVDPFAVAAEVLASTPKRAAKRKA